MVFSCQLDEVEMPSGGPMRGSDASVPLHRASLGFLTAWWPRAGRAADMEAAYFMHG